MPPSNSNPRGVTVIRPEGHFSAPALREIWEFRALLYFLVWRDVKVRYKQTVIGIGWAVLQPVFMMLVFTLFFGNLAGISSNGVPYPLFAFSALLPWNLFARALSDGSTSLAANERLITKIYFPRIFLPVATVVAALVDFAVAMVVLVGLMLYYGIVPTLAIGAFPLFLAVAVLASIGIALWFSALDAKYRDVRYTLPFLTQLWLLATPIIYPLSMVPQAWRWLYSLNPMVGVVQGFRWSLLGQPLGLDYTFGISIAGVLAIFIGGLFYFTHAGRTLADVI